MEDQWNGKAQTMPGTNALDLVFDCLAAGDVSGALKWLSPDAKVWHCFDRIAHDYNSAAREWAAFVDAFPERTFTDIRRHSTSDGCVRQHVMTTRSRDGRHMSWEVCVVAVMAGGRIKRLDEYLDRAGSFSSSEIAQ